MPAYGTSAMSPAAPTTKTLIPMTKAMYVPKVETQFQAALTLTRQRGKTHYDRSARPLASLQAGQTVRIQTDRGYGRLGTVIGRAPQPNSYQVQARDATYVRNRRHLQYVGVHMNNTPCLQQQRSHLTPTVNLCQNPSLMSTSRRQNRCRNHLWLSPAQGEYQSPTLYTKTTLHKLLLFIPLLLQQFLVAV